MFSHVLNPKLERFNVPKDQRKYVMAFYISGMIAIVKERIDNGCNDLIDFSIEIISRSI